MRVLEDGRVRYKADRFHPKFGSDTRTLDSLDFISEATQHIPDAYKTSFSRAGTRVA